MKYLVPCICIAVAAASLSACNKPAANNTASSASAQASPVPVADTPASGNPLAQKPGLWQLTTSMAQLPKGMTTQICIDDNLGAKMAQMGAVTGGDTDCSQTNMHQTGATVDVDSTCQVNGRSFTSHIHMERISDAEYHQSIDTTTAQGHMTTTVVGKWQGACPADMKAGDMTMPGGMKMNMYDMLKKAAAQKTTAAQD